PLHQLLRILLAGGAVHSFEILRNAGTAKPATRDKQVIADAQIGPPPLPNCIDIYSEAVPPPGNLIHEADTSRQHGIGSVLHQLGTSVIHEQDAITVVVEGRIELGNALSGCLVRTPGNDTVRADAVVDRRAFTEKFGIGDYAD